MCCLVHRLHMICWQQRLLTYMGTSWFSTKCSRQLMFQQSGPNWLIIFGKVTEAIRLIDRLLHDGQWTQLKAMFIITNTYVRGKGRLQSYSTYKVLTQSFLVLTDVKCSCLGCTRLRHVSALLVFLISFASQNTV
jgi:hypothetical protein